MSKIDLISATSGRVEKVNSPFKLGDSLSLLTLAQAIRVYEDRRHPGLAKAKTRGEVAISTRKIYKQKGTGGARHGSKSAPIFVGGGIAHGPTGVKGKLGLTKRIAKSALSVAIAQKIKQGKLVLISGIEKVTSTKEAANLVGKIRQGKEGKVSLVLSIGNVGAVRFFRNIKNLVILRQNVVSAYDVFFGGIVAYDQSGYEVKKAKRVVKSKKK